MRKTFSLLILVFALGLHTGIAASETIAIPGTGDSQKILMILSEAFERNYPGKIVDIPESIGSSGGIKAAATGKCVLARVARPLKEKEKTYNLTYKVFAYSPVVFAVSSNVKWLDNLSSEQVVEIFSGKINSWDKLGGEKGQIYVALREEGDSSLETIKNNILKWNGIEFFAGETLYSTPEAAAAIAGHKNTIGFLPLAMVDKSKVNVLKLDGISPSEENVKNGSYKMVTPFALVWKGELKGLPKEFADFLYSQEARKIMLDNGVMPAEY